ncbi:MAG TPA: type II toxin-antitoxin system VapC family toxin [Solirubrobacteraceae bacterium]|nr:type II toxin-antitoxin system VapC family toxin [Solirubrobacteraceae bacterium]
MTAPLLLDSHALLWWEADDARLGAAAREAIEQPAVPLFFSAASIWELAIKQAQKRLALPQTLLATLSGEGFAELPISSAHALLAGALPSHHRDPFDRIIVAQAQTQGLTVVTSDARIAAYDVPVLW